MKKKWSRVRECGVCGRWTERGDHFESGNRNWMTGETPMDNWICLGCQAEAGRRGEGAAAFDDRERRGLIAV